MGSSKLIVFVGLLLAMVLLISSEVAARDLAETSNTVDTSATAGARETNGAAIEDAKHDHGGGGGGHGHGGRCYHGRCCGRYRCRCCNYAGEDVGFDLQAKP